MEKRDARNHIAWFGAWCFVLVGGFIYVSGILCDRENPFNSGNGSLRDLVLILLISPLFFFLGPRHNWLPAQNKPLSILLWNGLCYVLPFFLALHWEFVGGILGVGFSLKAEHLGSLDTRSKVVICFAAAAILTLIALHLFWANREGILWKYLGALIGIPILIGIESLILGENYSLHFHHYSVGAFFPFFRFRNIISLITQAIFLGLAVEGISRWGADPLFYKIP